MSVLTQITLGKSQAARLRLGDAYAWHQALWEAFPGQEREARKFLFRIDDAGRDFRVFLLSDTEPEPPVWGYWQPKTVAASYLEHSAYRFQLKANPTMRRNSDRRRLGIYGEDRLREWLDRKAEKHGFELLPNTLVIGAPIDESFVKNKKRGKLVSVEFRGALSVRNRERFCRAFETGVGSAKAFGFGLLMLAPFADREN